MSSLSATGFATAEQMIGDIRWMQADHCQAQTEKAGFVSVTSSVKTFTATATDAEEFAKLGDQMLPMVIMPMQAEEKDRITPLFHDALVTVIEAEVGKGQYSIPMKAVIVYGKKPE